MAGKVQPTIFSCVICGNEVCGYSGVLRCEHCGYTESAEDVSLCAPVSSLPDDPRISDAT